MKEWIKIKSKEQLLSEGWIETGSKEVPLELRNKKTLMVTSGMMLFLGKYYYIDVPYRNADIKVNGYKFNPVLYTIPEYGDVRQDLEFAKMDVFTKQQEYNEAKIKHSRLEYILNNMI
jgi:hypothetical protein